MLIYRLCLNCLVLLLTAYMQVLPASDVLLDKLGPGQLAPVLLTDAEDTLHLLYFEGPAKGGDIFYRQRAARADMFSDPVKVNSLNNTAMAVGGVRAPDMAVTADGQVHVIWMSMQGGRQAVYYSRSNKDVSAFSQQKNLMQHSEGLDAGVSIAAHGEKIYAVWTAHGQGNAEAQRLLYCALSKNGGKAFSAEVPLNAENPGICACCGIDAAVSADGALQVMYRNADGGNRDVVLLHGTPGKQWQSVTLDSWAVGMCPMSSMYTGGGQSGMLSWQTKDQVFFTSIDQLDQQMAAPGMGNKRKYSIAARNGNGETCIAWTEGMGWNKGGRLHWAVLDSDGRELRSGQRGDVPAWSRPALAVRSDGNFLLMY